MNYFYLTSQYSSSQPLQQQVRIQLPKQSDFCTLTDPCSNISACLFCHLSVFFRVLSVQISLRGARYVVEDWAALTSSFPAQTNWNPFIVGLVKLQQLMQSGDLSPSYKAIADYLEHLSLQFTSENWSFHTCLFISLFQLWPLTHFPVLFILSPCFCSGSCRHCSSTSCFRHNMV